MTKPTRMKTFLALLLLAPLLVIATIWICHAMVEFTARDRLYQSVDKTPARKAALVLGCSRTLLNGRQNRYFNYRIQAASDLYFSGKCQYLIVSGDNSRKDYDEPTDMQQALVAKGIPESKIYRDFAGFRTLDSVVRAQKIFNQDQLTIVSQPFHNKRAIFLASRYDIDAIGFNSSDVTDRGGLKTKLREYLARVKMVLDLYLFQTEPKFLGPKVELGGPRPQHS